jgi:hypothetical protein
LFFFSIDRGEPWMQPLALAHSRNLRSHELNELARLIEAQRGEIERKWHEHFGGEA